MRNRNLTSAIKCTELLFFYPSWNLIYKDTIKQHGQSFSRPRQTICAFPDSGHLHRVLLCFALKFWAKSAHWHGGSWAGALGRLEEPLGLSSGLLGSSNPESALDSSKHHDLNLGTSAGRKFGKATRADSLGHIVGVSSSWSSREEEEGTQEQPNTHRTPVPTFTAVFDLLFP